jgi:hypothetical protein
MKFKREDNMYIVQPSQNRLGWHYAETYEKALYFAAFSLVGDNLPFEDLKSFHSTLRIALNKEFQGNLGDKIDFTGKWWYPSKRYTEKKQEKVKYLTVN